MTFWNEKIRSIYGLSIGEAPKSMDMVEICMASLYESTGAKEMGVTRIGWVLDAPYVSDVEVEISYLKREVEGHPLGLIIRLIHVSCCKGLSREKGELETILCFNKFDVVFWGWLIMEFSAFSSIWYIRKYYSSYRSWIKESWSRSDLLAWSNSIDESCPWTTSGG